MQDAHGSTGQGTQLGGCTGKGFIPGRSGNPAGRPKGSGVTDRLRRILEEDDGAVAEILAQEIVRAARRGDHRFMKLILDRVEGPVVPQGQDVYVKVLPQDAIDGAV